MTNVSETGRVLVNEPPRLRVLARWLPLTVTMPVSMLVLVLVLVTSSCRVFTRQGISDLLGRVNNVSMTDAPENASALTYCQIPKSHIWDWSSLPPDRAER